MEEILRISDEVTVMRDGAWVATEPAAEMTMERIIKLMVGRERTNRFPQMCIRDRPLHRCMQF